MATSPSDSSPFQPHRSNEQWIADLSGENGFRAQEAAYRDLSRYLYAVVYRYLAKRATSGHVLATFSPEELGELAEDFVQDTIEKLARNDHVLLTQYTGAGSFTAWCAQIAKRIAATEVRRPFWTRRKRSNRDGESMPEEGEASSAQSDGQSDSDPEASLDQQELRLAILACRETLIERYQTVFDRLIAEPEPAEEVAAHLGITVNAIYMLVFRVKKSMRKCLAAKGYGPDEE